MEEIMTQQEQLELLGLELFMDLKEFQRGIGSKFKVEKSCNFWDNKFIR
jgi:hypothetical protein